MNFASLPDRRAELDPGGSAVSDKTRSLTNAEFLNRVRAAAQHLKSLGGGPGDVVALRLANRLEFVILLFATWRLAATVTPVNPSLTDGEVAQQLGDSGACLLVVENNSTPVPGLASLPIGDLPAEAVGTDNEPRVDSSALALLIYTSGTTGVPKGVMLDHANLIAMAQMGREALEIRPDDRCLLILPLFHVNGILVSILMPLLADASVVIAERFNPQTFFNLVESVEGLGRLIHLAPALYESLGLPYTGAGSEAMYLTSNKPLAKRLLAAAGIAAPEGVEPTAQGLSTPTFAGPYIVKSVWEHASIGIDESSVVDDARKVAAVARKRQRRFGGEWFAERFIDGREFNLSLLGGPEGVELLPPAEMLFVDYPRGKRRIVDYAAKWHAGSFEFCNTTRRFEFDAADRSLLAQLEETAKTCWRLFGLSGYARVDCRVDADGRPWVLEINVNPCLSPDAGFAAAAGHRGLDTAAVLRRIIADLPAGIAEPTNGKRVAAAAETVPQALPR